VADAAAPWRVDHDVWVLIGRDAELASAIRQLDRVQAVALLGPAGIGKTSLAAAVAQQRRGVVVHVAATPMAAQTPLGALHLALDLLTPTSDEGRGVTPDEPPDAASAVRAMTTAMLAHAGPSTLVVVVDDVDQLDTASGEVLRQLVVAPQRVELLLTLRTGSPAPGWLHALWTQDRCGRIDLGVLGHQATAALGEQFVGGRLDPLATRQLHETTGGNPLYVRELVRDAVERGSLHPPTTGEADAPRPSDHHTGPDVVWVWDARPTPGARLADVVAGHLGQLDEAEADFVACLAEVGQLPLDVAERLAPATALESLERRGVIAVGDHERARPVRFAHPIYGEVFRPSDRGIGRRAMLRRLVDAYSDVDPSDHDRRRVVGWRLELGAAIDPGELLWVAASSRTWGNMDLAERCARAALEVAASTEALVLLGEIVFTDGRAGEAEACIRRIAPVGEIPAVVRDDELAARVIALELRVLDATGRQAEAEAALRQAQEIDSPEWRGFVEALWSGVMARLARISEATRIAEPLMHHPDPRVQLRALQALNAVRVSYGHIDASRADAMRLMPEALRLRDELFAAPAWIAGSLFLCAWASGDLDQADLILDLADDDALTAVPVHLASQLMSRARIALLRGNLELATGAARRACAIYAETDEEGWHGQALGQLIEALAVSGDVRGAVAAHAELTTVFAQREEPYYTPDIRRSAAWAAAVDGRVGDAIAELTANAEDAAAGDMRLYAAFSLHDAIRLGAPPATATVLRELLLACEGERAEAITAHAIAVERGDGRGFEDAADRFDKLGMRLVAAELLAEAAQAHAREGLQSSSRAAAARSRLMAGPAGASITLARRPPTDAPRLTRRELEVANLAARGMASKDVAERLHLSVRTVEGHLGNVYAKLGVNSRAALADVLGEWGDSGSG